MLLSAFALTLLALVAGMLLLAQTKKENLGNLYKYVSWFVIVMALLSELCIGARCAMRCRKGGYMMTKECRMMDDDDGCMMGHGMMGCHRGMMGGCNMMMGGGCCGMMMNGCCGHMGCNEGMGSCHEGMGSCHEGMGGGSCNEEMGECHEGGGECKEGKGAGGCPMMKGDMHGMMKDSTKKK